MNTRIQPASGRERAIIEYLAALDAQLIAHQDVLRERLKPAARTPEQIIASEDDLREIINAAMAAECAVCLKDDRQAKGCKLRRALMNIVPPETFSAQGCEYRDVAIQCDYGEYI